MPNTLIRLGAPKDTEKPDKVTMAFRTVNQVEELRARLKLLADEMGGSGKPGALSVEGRIVK